MIEVLAVFVGIDNIEEANWRPQINAVENTLNSCRQRHLTYRGKSIDIYALALSPDLVYGISGPNARLGFT